MRALYNLKKGYFFARDVVVLSIVGDIYIERGMSTVTSSIISICRLGFLRYS